MEAISTRSLKLMRRAAADLGPMDKWKNLEMCLMNVICSTWDLLEISSHGLKLILMEAWFGKDWIGWCVRWSGMIYSLLQICRP